MLAVCIIIVSLSAVPVLGYWATRGVRPERQELDVRTYDDPSVVECVCGAVSPVGRVDELGVECGFSHAQGCPVLASIREGERTYPWQDSSCVDGYPTTPRVHPSACRYGAMPARGDETGWVRVRSMEPAPVRVVNVVSS